MQAKYENSEEIAEAILASKPDEPCTYEVEGDGWAAEVEYKNEIRMVRGGDSYCGIWEQVPEIVWEDLYILHLWSEEGDDLPEDQRAEINKILSI